MCSLLSWWHSGPCLSFHTIDCNTIHLECQIFTLEMNISPPCKEVDNSRCSTIGNDQSQDDFSGFSFAVLQVLLCAQHKLHSQPLCNIYLLVQASDNKIRTSGFGGKQCMSIRLLSMQWVWNIFREGHAESVQCSVFLHSCSDKRHRGFKQPFEVSLYITTFSLASDIHVHG